MKFLNPSTLINQSLTYTNYAYTLTYILLILLYL